MRTLNRSFASFSFSGDCALALTVNEYFIKCSDSVSHCEGSWTLSQGTASTFTSTNPVNPVTDCACSKVNVLYTKELSFISDALISYSSRSLTFLVNAWSSQGGLKSDTQLSIIASLVNNDCRVGVITWNKSTLPTSLDFTFRS